MLLLVKICNLSPLWNPLDVKATDSLKMMTEKLQWHILSSKPYFFARMRASDALISFPLR